MFLTCGAEDISKTINVSCFLLCSSLLCAPNLTHSVNDRKRIVCSLLNSTVDRACCTVDRH